MALRVLLADESATIKKVFQLALQDFNVDVSSVNVGGDVLPVAARMRPDIIFIDVLLQKKNGYEVAKDLKTNADLRSTPVVLIWSGFMELDQEKFRSSGADGHLEKPFDTEKLRSLVKKLVPRTQSQVLSQFLDFPDLPDFVEEQKKPAAAPTQAPTLDVNGGVSPEPSTPPHSGTWNMDNFEPLNTTTEETSDDFLAVELPSEPPRLEPNRNAQSDFAPSQPDDEDRSWVQKTITQFKLPKEKTVERKPEVRYQVPDDKIDGDSIVTNAQWTRTGPTSPPVENKKAPSTHSDDSLELDLTSEGDISNVEVPQLNEKQLEAIIRAQAKDVIERVVWQVLPEIASRIIEREIERLLKEREKN